MKQLNLRRLALMSTMVAMTSFLTSCSTDSFSPTKWQSNSNPLSGGIGLLPKNQFSGNPNGSAGDMPAYYDSMLVTINFKELPPQAEKEVLAHNHSINIIYMSDNGLPNDQPFISVIDAIPGDGFNPLWREVQIVFNSGFTPHQLFSDDQIQTAATGTNPEITLVPTDEVYRCSVVGQKQ